MRELDELFTDGLCTGAMICELLWQLVLEVSEWEESSASAIFAVRSSHWQQRPGRIGGLRRYGLWGWPVKYTCWSACCGWVLLWWPVNWDKVGLYLAKTCRWPGASGFGDEYEARASQRVFAGRSGGYYMGLWWRNGWHCDRLHPICWVECWRLFCKLHRRSWGSVGWSVLWGYVM